MTWRCSASSRHEEERFASDSEKRTAQIFAFLLRRGAFPFLVFDLGAFRFPLLEYETCVFIRLLFLLFKFPEEGRVLACLSRVSFTFASELIFLVFEFLFIKYISFGMYFYRISLLVERYLGLFIFSFFGGARRMISSSARRRLSPGARAGPDLRGKQCALFPLQILLCSSSCPEPTRMHFVWLRITIEFLTYIHMRC